MKDLLDIQIIPKGIPANNFSADNFNNFPLAYAYVPYQRFEEPYDKEKALMVGSIFPSLNKPLGVYGKDFSKEGFQK